MAGDSNWSDLIGQTLGAYATIETAKINSRFASSQSQPAAYDTPSMPQAVNTRPESPAKDNNLLMWGGLALVGLVALVLVTR